MVIGNDVSTKKLLSAVATNLNIYFFQCAFYTCLFSEVLNLRNFIILLWGHPNSRSHVKWVFEPIIKSLLGFNFITALCSLEPHKIREKEIEMQKLSLFFIFLSTLLSCLFPCDTLNRPLTKLSLFAFNSIYFEKYSSDLGNNQFKIFLCSLWNHTQPITWL